MGQYGSWQSYLLAAVIKITLQIFIVANKINDDLSA